MKQKPNKDLQFLKDYFLLCPETREKQKIIDIISNEKGLDVIVQGKSTKWKHTIQSKEI